jgi:transcription elongation GreA/GreB family factor
MAKTNNAGDNAKVEIGCWVKVREEGMDEEETFQIGEVTRLQANQIAQDNALGQALIGSSPGDEVTVDGPTGPITLAVLEVGRGSGES